MPIRPSKKAVRTSFHHGHLRRALLRAGVELARKGGPAAVILREATRRVGVAPNAAYRHFAGHASLLAAVRSAALSELARAIESELERLPSAKPAAHARASLRAVGTAYLRFALRETGLFRTAFSTAEPVPDDRDQPRAGESGLNPFQLLGRALDQMVSAGVLPPERRPGAEYLAWSAVHGMAFLVIDGPLHGAPEARIAALTDRLLEMVEKGI